MQQGVLSSRGRLRHSASARNNSVVTIQLPEEPGLALCSNKTLYYEFYYEIYNYLLRIVAATSLDYSVSS